MIEFWRDAAIFGALSVVLTMLARTRAAHVLVPLGLLVAAGVAAALDIVRVSWLPSSLAYDVPWGAAAALAVWSAQSHARWLRVRTWPAVVLATAIFGDTLVALGLAVAEADPARRARLVVAASGASLIGVTSGAAPLMLGWGGRDVAALGLLLAAVGWVANDGSQPARVAPDRGAAARAGWVALLAGLTAWFVALGGAADVVATGIEQLPMLVPDAATAPVAGLALLFGLVGDEGSAALLAREVVQRGLSIRDPAFIDTLRVGLAVGGTPALLWATGSRMRVGLGLWAIQLLIAGAFVALAWR